MFSATKLEFFRRFSSRVFVFVLFLITMFVQSSLVEANAQNTNATNAQASETSSTNGSNNPNRERKKSEEGTLSWVWESSAFQNLVIGLMALLTAGCGILTQRLLGSKERFEKQLHSDVKVPLNAKKNSIMVIGIGGSGKTSIRNSICNPQDSGTEEKTNQYTTKCLKTQADGDGHDYYYYVSDYKGQDFGTLISAFISQQLQAYTPMRFGYINTLIFVVDLFDPTQHLGPDGKSLQVSFQTINSARIKEHITEWNRTALDAVFGMQSQESLSYVCLFINKANFLVDRSPKMKDKILQEYDPLIEELKRRCQSINEKTKAREYYAQFEVIIGEAHALPASMMANLRKFSVPHLQKYGEPAVNE